MTKTQDERFETLLETICLEDGSMAPEVLGLIPPGTKALALRVQTQALRLCLEMALRGGQQALGDSGAFAVLGGKAITDDFRAGWRECGKAIAKKIEEALAREGSV